MTETIRHLQLMLRTRKAEDGKLGVAVVAVLLGGDTVDLTDDYPTEHEAVAALAAGIRKGK